MGPRVRVLFSSSILLANDIRRTESGRPSQAAPGCLTTRPCAACPLYPDKKTLIAKNIEKTLKDSGMLSL
jgi:hypothetical protein